MTPRVPILVGSLLIAGLVFTAPARGGGPPVSFNIIVHRNTVGFMSFVAAGTGPDGRFSASVRLPQAGDYEIFSACRAGAPCPSHELVSLTVNGQPVPRGENAALQTGGRGVYTVTAPAAGSSVVIAGEVRAVAVEAPRPPSARLPGPVAPRRALPLTPAPGVRR